MRFFNTEGPVRPDDHYAIPPLDRMDIDELLALIRAKRYFVLHAPRQTGKTSALIALRDLLNSGEAGNFRCVHTNVEVGQAARDDTARGMRAILSRLAMRARLLHDDFPHESWRAALEASGPDDALGDLLSNWCVANPVPLVLLMDEIDSLVGDTLLSVLRQLRAGYEQRPEAFPQSVVLCGVRDIRDYRIRSSAGEVIAGGSPFNVAAKSLRMGDFTEAETRTLMAQHTEETGQRFSAAALDAVWTQTQGQPWLVNALCAGACFDNKAGRDRSRTIEALAIPHNMDKSRGRAFPETDWKGRPIDRAFAEKRLRNEPIVEIVQEKGVSETHPLFSPNDEWADFQTFRYYDGRESPVGDYYRQGLKRGLAIERRIGVNPYRFGAVGGSDSKLGAGAFDEADFFKTRLEPHERGSAYPQEQGGWEGYRTPHVATHGSAGLTGLWAEENTRAALFRALRRRETFATSGPRLRVRFFGGFGLAQEIGQSRAPVAASYAHGVPMGGVLTGAAGSAPDFFVWAMRDPRSGRLQRAQIVKGWLEDGEARERVFDVVCSDGLEPDPDSHRCPDNGARVDLADCSTSRDRGAAELRTVWTDPDFDAGQPGFYYVRVLENPSCRWSTWDAVRAGIEPNPVLPPVIQERAWSSPVWYAPGGP